MRVRSARDTSHLAFLWTRQGRYIENLVLFLFFIFRLLIHFNLFIRSVIICIMSCGCRGRGGGGRGRGRGRGHFIAHAASTAAGEQTDERSSSREQASSSAQHNGGDSNSPMGAGDKSVTFPAGEPKEFTEVINHQPPTT